MPLFPTSEEWQRQSTLLLQARPSTTRITTKYHIPNLSSARVQKTLQKQKSSRRTNNSATATTDPPSSTDPAAAAAAAAATSTPAPPKAYLELKTFDPQSGVCLKYKTDKAAEVGRLIAGLGRLGRSMAALPALADDVEMRDAAAPQPELAGSGTGMSTPLPDAAAEATKPAQGGAGGGGKKKKKGGKK
ncbi:hypothetical protein MBLNU459_g4748t1 [Dothideomycetes sp. NU459]